MSIHLAAGHRDSHKIWQIGQGTVVGSSYSNNDPGYEINALQTLSTEDTSLQAVDSLLLAGRNNWRCSCGAEQIQVLRKSGPNGLCWPVGLAIHTYISIHHFHPKPTWRSPTHPRGCHKYLWHAACVVPWLETPSWLSLIFVINLFIPPPFFLTASQFFFLSIFFQFLYIPSGCFKDNFRIYKFF